MSSKGAGPFKRHILDILGTIPGDHILKYVFGCTIIHRIVRAAALPCYEKLDDVRVILTHDGAMGKVNGSLVLIASHCRKITACDDAH